MKKYRTLIFAGALSLMLAACTADEEVDSSSAGESESKSEQISNVEKQLQMKKQNEKYLI